MFFLWENEGAFVCPLNQFRLEEIRMAYNHGREDRKWRIWKEAEEKVLRECGVDEETIEQIRTDDRADFNSNRRATSANTLRAWRTGRSRQR